MLTVLNYSRMLLGEQHSFIHDLKSFFRVLFWICVHYNGPYEGRVVPCFERWNYVDTEALASLKGEIDHEANSENFIHHTTIHWYTSIFPIVPYKL